MVFLLQRHCASQLYFDKTNKAYRVKFTAIRVDLAEKIKRVRHLKQAKRLREAKHFKQAKHLKEADYFK